jgi:hypothetical protein
VALWTILWSRLWLRWVFTWPGDHNLVLQAVEDYQEDLLELKSRFLTGRLPGVFVSSALASWLRVPTLWRAEGVAGFGPSAGSARVAIDRFRRLRNDLSVAYEQAKISPRIGRPARR